MPFLIAAMKKKFRRSAQTALVLVYLVIAAGAIVRMTGSGMGCPDWPKCFGYYIPPTDRAQLEWDSERSYKKGQVIILDEALQVANTDIAAGNDFNSDQWEPYTRHDYAEFNAFHTWTEFINRLLGALAGLAILVMSIFSTAYWKSKKSVTIVSFITLVAIGFQAWLGATVVYSVLAPVKITIHMLMALVIVGLLLWLVYTTQQPPLGQQYRKPLKILLIGALALSLVQIVMGTQVRQFVDEQIDLFGTENPATWLADPNMVFYIHRSFSLLVLLLNGGILYLIYRYRLGFGKVNALFALILAEILTGILMYYADFPFGSQPLHLVLAALMFGVQFYLLLEVVRAERKMKLS